jgi:hypothetical protein
MTDRAKTVLQVILLAAVVSSIIHYTDNTIRFDQYPQDEPALITRPMIPLSWLAFTAFAAWGYVLYRRERWEAAAACLAVYSVSGLISPLHYTAAPLGEFDAFQHLLILTDALTGVATVGFAAWLVMGRRAARAVVGSG